MALTPLTGKTVPELGVETPPIVDADKFVVYRAGSPPLKSTTAATLAAYMRTKINGGEFIYLADYLNGQPVGDAFREAIADAVTAGLWVLVPAGEYTITGAYNTEGVLGLDGAGTVGLVCRDGWATLKLPLTAGTGLISTTLNSQTVTGNGSALFTSALIGKNLQNAAGEYIGKVDTVESPTSLTLVDPAWREISTPGAWSYSSEARAFFTQTDGADVYFENIEFDCAAITTNFGHKAVAGGRYEGTTVRYRYKSFRFLDDGVTAAPAISAFNIDNILTVDVQGHGVTGGADATTANMGSGYIGLVDNVNCTKSGLNISVLRSTSQLYVGRVSSVWNRWVEEGMPFPTQYAALRLGNGVANVTVGYVWGEGVFRLIRLTDPDNCNVIGYGFRNILGPVVLFNSKDQVSVNSGVGIGFGIGPNRGNGRPLPGDEDGESISNPNEEAVVIAEGQGYGFGPATYSSDEYILGLGTITATSGNASIVNKDETFRGQDINCFADVSVGDFLFEDDETLLGQVTAISLKSYWSDAGSTVPIGTSGSSTVSVALGGTTLVKAGGTSFVGVVSSGDIILNSLGNVVGTVTGTILADALTFAEGAAIEMPLGSAWWYAGGISSAVNATQTATLSGGSLQTVPAGSVYRQRTPDPYFYTGGGGLATVSGTAMTIPAPVADLGGTITTLTSSKEVVGVGTSFNTQYVVGQHLFTTGDVSIGQIASFGRRVNGQIVNKDTYLQLVNNAAQAVSGANFKYGYNFQDVLAVGDAIFKSDDTLIGEIATINNAQSITLSATALTTLPGEAYQFGRWKKTARGVEIAETAINTNIDLNTFWCQGAVAQYRLQQPAGIRPHNENTILQSQLSEMDATERRGEQWYVSDGNGFGWFRSNGTSWVRTSNNGVQTSAPTESPAASGLFPVTITYRTNTPCYRIAAPSGALYNVTQVCTLAATNLPIGATYTIMLVGSGASSYDIQSSGGTSVVVIRPGQSVTVSWDGSNWRIVRIGAAAAARSVAAGNNAPSTVPAKGDLYSRLNGGPGTTLYVAEGSAGTSADWTPIQSALDAVYAESYGVSASNPSNLVAFNLALDAANTAGKTLILPAGQLTFPDASPVFNILDNTRIVGAGRGRTILYFTGLDTTTDVFSITAKSKVFIADLSLEASTLRTSSNLAFAFFDCVDCTVYRCGQTNFTQGFVFARDAGAVPPTTTNLRNKAIECISLVSQSYGFFMDFATACEFINCEAYSAANQDGFKTGGGSTFVKIIGCHSEGNNQDGFDTYDGFISSVLADCTAYDNAAAGFQIKGTLGGTYGSATYVDRESVVSNCVAQGNASNGFLFQEARQIVISGLISVENALAGFVFNNCQQFTVTSCVAVRNTQHGFSLIGNTTRSSFAACTAVDNSYVDGTVQNGTYNGWNLDTGTNSLFTGCRSGNGTTTGFVGGQGYGYNTTTSSGNVFTGCSALTNVTGSITGTTPYASNYFAGFVDNGTYRGWATADAAGSLLYTGTIYRSTTVIQGIGTGTPEGAVTGGIGSTFQRTDGGAGTSFYVKESGTGNTGWVAK